MRNRTLGLLLCLAAFSASCGASINQDVIQAAVDITEPTATPTPPPTATPVPTPTPTPEPTSTPTPTATPEPVPTVEPTPTATPVPIEFVIAPNAPLLGVALGTETEAALAQLTSLIGSPDEDTGWYVGCPLDGDDLNERLVQWGDLNVYFDLFDGDAGVLRAWGYDVRVVAGGFPEPELVMLPGGSRLGDPINQVAVAAGLAVRYDETFDINRVGDPGYEIVSDAPPGAPAWGAFVPFVPSCE